LRAVADVPGIPSAEELAALPHAELAARLAEDAAAVARQAGQAALDADVLEDLVTRYRAIAAAGLAASLYRRTATAKDARRIARRFLHFEDLILRFATRPRPGYFYQQ
jgi:hypothetical protein